MLVTQIYDVYVNVGRPLVPTARDVLDAHDRFGPIRQCMIVRHQKMP